MNSEIPCRVKSILIFNHIILKVSYEFKFDVQSLMINLQLIMTNYLNIINLHYTRSVQKISQFTISLRLNTFFQTAPA